MSFDVILLIGNIFTRVVLKIYNMEMYFFAIYSKGKNNKKIMVSKNEKSLYRECPRTFILSYD